MKRNSTAAAVGALGSLLSLIIGAGSDLLLAWRFGAHAPTDAYFAGIAIPLALGGVLGASVTFTFVPILTASRDDTRMSAGVLWDVAGVALVGTVVAALLGVFADGVTTVVVARLPLPTHMLASAVLVRFAAAVPGAAHVRLLRRLAACGIAGGRAYDAIICECARRAGAETLLTFNDRHFVQPPSRIGIGEVQCPCTNVSYA